MHRYQVSAQVVNETIDGEAVMINLATGAYYSLRGAGAGVWDALEAGASPEEIVDHVSSSLGLPRSDVAQDVTVLVAELLKEELLVLVEGSGEPAGTLPSFVGPYEVPTLEKFTDMEDLILLDPVHEVDDRGWPHRPGDELGRAD